MSQPGQENAEVEILRAQTERDRAALGDTVQELADKLDVKQQASRARAALSESGARWLRGHRPAAIAAAGATAMLLFVYVWRRRSR